MNVDLEDIRIIVNRHPNIRGKNLLHQLEKRRKVEELREQRERRDAMVKEMDAKSGLFSWFDTWMGRG
jgi:hypothetical protein